jgi:hypothetical protein
MKLSNKCDLGNFSITIYSDCESCGVLEPYSVTWSDGGTWWCLDCARYNKNFELTEEFEKKLLKLQKEKLIKYHTKGLKEATNRNILI